MKPAWNLLLTLGQALPLSLALLPATATIALATPKTLLPKTAQPVEISVQSAPLSSSHDESGRAASVTLATWTPGKRTQLVQAKTPLPAQSTLLSPAKAEDWRSPIPDAWVNQSTVQSKSLPAVTLPSPALKQDNSKPPESTKSDDTAPTTTSPSPPKNAQPTETNPAKNKPDPDAEAEAEAEAAEKTPEAISRFHKLAEADRLYQEGKFAEAEKLYRQVKPPMEGESTVSDRPQALFDPSQLSPAGQVYWREAEAGIAQHQESRTKVALDLLMEKHPEFIPGQLQRVQMLIEEKKSEQALEVLEQLNTRYPDHPGIVKARVTALANEKQYLEASIAARQFALLHPDRPDAAEFTTLADEQLKHHQSRLRRKLREQAIGGVLTGAVGYVLTGNIFGPLSAIQTTALLLQGESAVGARVAKQVQRQEEMVDDRLVVDYVNELGQKLAKATGRNDFQYEFYVILDKDLNAFALPGGKVFVNAGAIAKTNSEAELAGLLAHELSHAILSHGFQLMTKGNLTFNLAQFIPRVGGLVGNLLTLNYSRDMERQADVLGTRLLASSGYAADGLYNLMITLGKENQDSPPSWLSSHPATKNRIRYLAEQIQENGYNRYAYEGVERHAEVRARVRQLLRERLNRATGTGRWRSPLLK